jgi:MinD-like ATPase involved in chromosome partitioning or flagellar assembly
VPSDYQTTVNSINLGTPLVKSDPNSKIAHELRSIAEKIQQNVESPVEQAKPRRSLWNSFLKRDASTRPLTLQTSVEKI